MAEAEKIETKAEDKPSEIKKILHPQKLYFRDGERIARDEAIIPMGHTHSQVLNDPAYFTHSIKRIRPNTIIRYIAEDYSFGGELLIPRVVDGLAKGISLHKWDREDVEDITEVTSIYTVKAAATGFRVVLKATGKVVKDNIPTKQDAYSAMMELETKAKKAA